MASKVSRVVVSGPLAGVADRFGVVLAERGYTPLSAANQLRVLAHLSRWMSSESVTAAMLTGEALDRFLAARRAAGYTAFLSWRGIGVVVGVLREEGLIPGPSPVMASAVDVVVTNYRLFLADERGLAASTIDGRERVARAFLDDWFSRHDDLGDLTAVDVVEFMSSSCASSSVGTAKLTLSGLRSVLRFLHVSGQVGVDLSSAVLAAAGWRHAGLPRGLDDGQVSRLLAACDRRRAVGRRDFAIVTLLARLGLRAAEVAGLRLDDIDWRAGVIAVVGKGRREEQLPLPVDVGEAVVAYLQRGRPASGSRAVFLRVRAPSGPLTAAGIKGVVQKLGVRSGLGPVGSHRLRHTAATSMLRHGGDLGEIGQVLRHRSLTTTAIYAKVDRTGLRRLALPWPEPVVLADGERRDRLRRLAPPWPEQAWPTAVSS